ncbi:MAG: hypothetical protein Q8908_00005 [Bacteroidota bacterium]|nr:hypothetical protein [Bacteroidota bacterium]
MKINLKEEIAGFPLLKIRDLLKSKDFLYYEIVAIFLKTDQNQAKIVLTELIDLGFIERDPAQISILYVKTLKGNSLANAKAFIAIPKERAKKIFFEFMERVQEVNQNSKYIFKVSKVILFGSYIKDSPTVNDIDIAIEMIRKDENDDIFNVKHEIIIQEAIRKGKRFNNILDRLSYPNREVLKYLKSNSRYLSFHSMTDGILKEIETKQVYP